MCPRLTPCLALKTHSVCLTPSDRLYTRNLVFNSKNAFCSLPLHVLQTLASNALVSPADTQYSREALVRFAQHALSVLPLVHKHLLNTRSLASLGDLLTVLALHSNKLPLLANSCFLKHTLVSELFGVAGRLGRETSNSRVTL